MKKKKSTPSRAKAKAKAKTKATSTNTRSRSASLSTQLVGTWKLISAEDKDPKTGKWKPYTFGNPPSGYFIYTALGHASVQIMTTPPVSIASPDNPTPQEALAIFNGYIGYYGTFTADGDNIYHQVEGAWDPSQVGSVQTRPYEIVGGQLIIGDQVTYIRVLEKIV
jgi:hypothetical protein